MKKFLIFCFVFTLSLGSAYATGSFPDVPKDHKNYEAIEYLDNEQIINGYEDGTFGPDNLVNRAEAMKMISVAFEVDIAGEYEILFPDVVKEDWFFPYVMAAQKAEIVKGYDDGKFKPEESVNLAETMKMMMLAAKVELPAAVGNIFSDVEEEDWFYPYMLFARDKNIILPDDFGAVYPDQAMTRAYFARSCL